MWSHHLQAIVHWVEIVGDYRRNKDLICWICCKFFFLNFLNIFLSLVGWKRVLVVLLHFGIFSHLLEHNFVVHWFQFLLLVKNYGFDFFIFFWCFLVMTSALERRSGFNKETHLIKDSEFSKLGKKVTFFWVWRPW